jgi:hypothetical protein
MNSGDTTNHADWFKRKPVAGLLPAKGMGGDATRTERHGGHSLQDEAATDSAD